MALQKAARGRVSQRTRVVRGSELAHQVPPVRRQLPVHIAARRRGRARGAHRWNGGAERGVAALVRDAGRVGQAASGARRLRRDEVIQAGDQSVPQAPEPVLLALAEVGLGLHPARAALVGDARRIDRTAFRARVLAHLLATRAREQELPLAPRAVGLSVAEGLRASGRAVVGLARAVGDAPAQAGDLAHGDAARTGRQLVAITPRVIGFAGAEARVRRLRAGVQLTGWRRLATQLADLLGDLCACGARDEEGSACAELAVGVAGAEVHHRGVGAFVCGVRSLKAASRARYADDELPGRAGDQRLAATPRSVGLAPAEGVLRCAGPVVHRRLLDAPDGTGQLADRYPAGAGDDGASLAPAAVPLVLAEQRLEGHPTHVRRPLGRDDAAQLTLLAGHELLRGAGDERLAVAPVAVGHPIAEVRRPVGVRARCLVQGDRGVPGSRDRVMGVPDVRGLGLPILVAGGGIRIRAARCDHEKSRHPDTGEDELQCALRSLVSVLWSSIQDAIAGAGGFFCLYLAANLLVVEN